jgi:transposase
VCVRAAHGARGGQAPWPEPSFDRASYRERNRVERLINRLKQFRRIATRYEKLGVPYLAMVTIAAVQM